MNLTQIRAFRSENIDAPGVTEALDKINIIDGDNWRIIGWWRRGWFKNVMQYDIYYDAFRRHTQTGPPRDIEVAFVATFTYRELLAYLKGVYDGIAADRRQPCVRAIDGDVAHLKDGTRLRPNAATGSLELGGVADIKTLGGAF